MNPVEDRSGERPSRSPVGDLLLFAAMLGLAALERWSITDLVWSLWISSLLVGYALILTFAFTLGLRRNPVPTGGSGAPPRVPAVLGLLGTASRLVTMLFMIAFFTVHFGGFHFVHSIFLNAFFPITAAEVFGTTPPETGGWWFGVIGTALSRYWPFVLASAISARSAFRRALDGSNDNIMILPYKNVVRMHLMIFVFAFLSAFSLSGWALWIVLFFYFFPLGAVLRGRRTQAPADVPPTPEVTS
jgi:hypothetical protein